MSTRRGKITLASLLVVWTIVAFWAWSSMRTASPPISAAVAARDPGRPSGLEEGVSIQLRLDLLNRVTAVAEPRRDLFSTAPLAPADPAEPAGPPEAEGGAGVPTVGAQLRYMGYVETGGGTIALLRDGPEMYLAQQGDRVGPGYLITVVDAMFIEIEYRGARRRLPVYAPANGNNRR